MLQSSPLLSYILCYGDNIWDYFLPLYTASSSEKSYQFRHDVSYQCLPLSMATTLYRRSSHKTNILPMESCINIYPAFLVVVCIFIGNINKRQFIENHARNIPVEISFQMVERLQSRIHKSENMFGTISSNEIKTFITNINEYKTQTSTKIGAWSGVSEVLAYHVKKIA